VVFEKRVFEEMLPDGGEAGAGQTREGGGPELVSGWRMSLRAVVGVGGDGGKEGEVGEVHMIRTRAADN
tara:strand:+ start:13 stop:219 length:207 start_codon:yes stop_codon:yes gene_type:complete